ncbi:MAG: phenylalanine--tRNA ligase subunit beta [Candidatus Diapherotrites archaeon]
MPTVETSKKDLEKLCGMKFTKEKLETALLFAKGELDGIDGDTLKIDIKDANRPDLWSIEGIARVIKAGYGKSKGVPKWKMKNSGVDVFIEKSVSKSRPYITCAIVKNVRVTEDLLIQMIQLQEKVGDSYGRKRAEVGIGLYDFDKLKPPIYYRGYKPKDLEFVPLEFKVPMRLDEILMKHPKGIKYAHLLKGKENYPIVIDSANVVASMPPIINSETTGKVDDKTKNIFIECTGFDWERVNVALNVIISAFLERGAQVETTKIHLPNGKVKVTPDFTPGKIKIDLKYVNKISGLGLKINEVVKLLQNSNYDVKAKGNSLDVSYPAYRQDILHPVDVVEDIIIAYGYNEIEPELVKVSTKGNESAEAIEIDLVRNVCVGLGLQEVLTFTLVSKEAQETKMNLKDVKFVEIENPVSENWCVFRKSIIPEILSFLATNKHSAYPQRLFEIGKTVHIDSKSETCVTEKNLLTIVITDNKTNFTEIKSIMETIAQNFGWNYSVERKEHPSFEKGKCAAIKIGKHKGVLGEISKDVLKNFNLSIPVSVLEIEL